MPIDAELQAAYLRRLGLDAEPPSADALQHLHRRQVERVPYETMWIHAGEAWGIEPADSVQRVARDGRGGYCFHLNGAFSELLRSLGYMVTRHVGGVHGPGGPDAEMLSNHLVLTVAGLPTDENPAGTWYVDAGLGDALYETVPLAPAAFEQGPFHLVLAETDDGVGDWHLTHDPAGSFTGMSWRTAPATIGDFAERHRWLSTSPESGFVRVATAQRRDATGVDIVRGLVVTRVGEGAATTAPLTERADWFGALADIFDLRFEHTPPEALDNLWASALASHERWEAAGRP
ncbi:MAG: arylamine N-acetyltransferase family protein [Acidimicrobiales bacterium]